MTESETGGTMKIYTTKWRCDCRRAKRFLEPHGVPFQEIDIEETEGAADYVMAATQGKRRVPAFELEGRTFYCSPYDPQQLAQESGLKSNGCK